MSSYQYAGQELDTFALAANWKAYFSDLLGDYIRGDVLEVGAGIGETTRALRKPSTRAGAAAARVTSWTCIEPDAQLAARLRASDVPATVITGTLGDLPAGASFDCILYIDVLEHIADDRAELRASAGRLRCGGSLIVLSPAFDILFSDFDRAVGHYRRYTKRSIAAAFPAELRAERVFYADALGALLSLANRLLLRQAMPSPDQVRFWDRRVVPVSRVIDRLVHRWFGRSVIAVYGKRG